MTAKFTDRIVRIVDELIHVHLDLLAVLLAEKGVDVSKQADALDRLVRALDGYVLRDSIFEGGRRLPISIELESGSPRIALNEELLSRVDDNEIIFALSAPIAEILELSPVSVALALAERDERHIRDLTLKASRRVESGAVRANAVDAVFDRKIKLLSDRLSSLALTLGIPDSFDFTNDDELAEKVARSAGWPDWIDVASSPSLQRAVNTMSKSLGGTPWAESAADVVEIVWEGVGVSSHSFLRNAGRMVRAHGLAEPQTLLAACARSVSMAEPGFDPKLDSWASFSEISDAWADLVAQERNLFGLGAREGQTPTLTVTEPAGLAFGMNDPEELPWDFPLLCWTVREQKALRDLLVGYSRTLPGADARARARGEVTADEHPVLDIHTGRGSASIQVMVLGAEGTIIEHDEQEKAVGAVMGHLVEQFSTLASDEQAEVVRAVRAAYDELFPKAAEIWARRFRDSARLPPVHAFRHLISEAGAVMGVPMLVDPFEDIESLELREAPTLVSIVGTRPTGGKTAFWLPLAALGATRYGTPIRVRVVEVDREANICRWVSDRNLHVGKLQGQSVDVMMRSIHGDALQMVVLN